MWRMCIPSPTRRHQHPNDHVMMTMMTMMMMSGTDPINKLVAAIYGR